MSDETKTMTYVVQQLVPVTVATGDQAAGYTTKSVLYWDDIATVEVEPRTKRSTVIKKALAEAGVDPKGPAPKLRALDAESAEVHEPEAHQPPPEWKL